MGLTSKTTVKEFMQKLLKHSAVEGLSEAVTDGLGQAAEYHILGDYSTFARRRSGYLGRGNTPEQATRKALKDTMSDLGFTMLAASAAGALAGGAQTVLDEHLLGIKQADADIAANKYPEGELLTLKRDLDFASKSHTRFTPEGQERWAALEKRFNELLSKHKNTMAAREQRKFHEDAIRKTVQSGEYEEPFSPELYRLALEVTSPYGWDGIDREAFGKSISGNQDVWQRKSGFLQTPGTGDNTISDFQKKVGSKDYSLENTSHDGIIKETIIHKSLGAKAKNYDVFDPESGEFFQFSEDSYIQNTEVFAGKNTKKSLHNGVAEGLCEQFGGLPENWQHCKGNGTIDYYGEPRPAEVHWFQESSVGKIKFKIKRWNDES